MRPLFCWGTHRTHSRPARRSLSLFPRRARIKRVLGDKRVRARGPARSSRAGWPVQVEPGRAPQSAESPFDFRYYENQLK